MRILSSTGATWVLVSHLSQNGIHGFMNSFGVPAASRHTFVSKNHHHHLQQQQHQCSTRRWSTPTSNGEEEKVSSGYTITSDNSGPDSSPVHTLTIPLNNNRDPLVIRTGQVGRQASGAITLSVGEMVLYATAARDNKVFGGDFLPLSVEHKERFSAAGTTSGSYHKRDGRPAEHEILTCRLIDRPLRPMVANGWRHDTQLLSWVLSYDGVQNPDPLAITGAAAALWLSDVPLKKPVAGVEVGLSADGSTFVLNPTVDEMAASSLQLIVAGTKDAVLMIEGAADFLSEETMMEAVSFGQKAVAQICEALEAFGQVAGKEKKTDTLPVPVVGLQERTDELFTARVDEIYGTPTIKASHSQQISELTKDVLARLKEEFPDDDEAFLQQALTQLLRRRMYTLARESSRRVDGRALDEVRPLDMIAGWLPAPVHGSALFTRGETQTIATATLGDKGMLSKCDTLDGVRQKRFYLQYNFPPSCVGETGRTGMPGRREVGHGNLAERALEPSLPSAEDFPYVIRLESLITESHGSSSMASVCGGSLALMDAGVPVKGPVAGIAMGMLLDNDGDDTNAVIVSDILGTEDALGTMDFKVAGDRTGITTFQLDIKCEGLSLETMARALAQAKQGRLHILDQMDQVLAEARPQLPDSVPKMMTFKINADSIGRVIGPGGKQIRAIIEDHNLVNMNVEEDGSIQLSSMNVTTMEAAKNFTEALISGGGGNDRGGGRGGGGGDRAPRPQYTGPPPEIGAVYKGKIKGIHPFGVFVEILPGVDDGPGLEGLCHVSELHVERVRNCEGFVSGMNTDELEVQVLGLNDRGKWQLSRKAVLTKNRKEYSRSNSNSDDGSKKAVADMPQDEIDVIAQAIEGISELN